MSHVALTPLGLAVLSLVFGSLILNACAYSISKVETKVDHGKPTTEVRFHRHESTKQSLQKPKVPETGSYGQKLIKQNNGKPKPEEKEKYNTIGIQGIIYCQSGVKPVPLKGAVARVTCLAMDNNGYEYESAPFSVWSKATDEKGYFLATLPISELESMSKFYKCKAYLDSSPMKSCNVPTNVNSGLNGALPYSSYHLLTNKKMKLYSVRPFVYRPTNPKLRGGVY